jgi:uroporphyrinogen-III synthase
MSALLHDCCILVTRPPPQGVALCKRIEEEGAQAVYCPTIAFENIAHPPALSLLGEQDWLIFNSPQAVYASREMIQHAFPSIAHTAKIAAVGAGTMKALYEAGYKEVIYPKEEWSSEGLLAMPFFQSIKNKKIAIIRGEGGRELLDKTLRARGASVLPLIVYKRILPSMDVQSYLALLQAKVIDVIVCASFEGVHNLKYLLGEAGWLYLQKIPLVVVSQRIKVLAHDLGFQTIWVAENASHSSILDIIAANKGTTYGRSNRSGEK